MQTVNLEAKVTAWMIRKLGISLQEFWKIKDTRAFLDAVEHAKGLEIIFPDKNCRFVCKEHSGVLLFQKGNKPAEIFRD